MRWLLILIFLSVGIFSFGQELKLQAYKVAGPELYKLNSTTRAELGGSCRLYVPLNIPRNAIYCYVTISTAGGNESQQVQNSVNLLAQVSSKIPTVTSQGIATLATLSEGILNVYKGSVVDISFMSSINDAQLFNLGRGGYRIMSQYSRTSYNGGTIALPANQFSGQTIYMGVSNNSAINSVWINVEAVVVTYTEVKSEISRERANAANYTNLGWQAFKNGNVDKCIEYSQKALQFDSTVAVAKLNLGLCQLVKNNEAEAVNLYMEGLAILNAQDKANLRHYLKEAIKDIKGAKEKYPDMAAGDDIVNLFKEELKK